MFSVTLIPLGQATLDQLMSADGFEDYLEEVLEDQVGQDPAQPTVDSPLGLDKFWYPLAELLHGDSAMALHGPTMVDDEGHITTLTAPEVQRVAHALGEMDRPLIEDGAGDSNISELFDDLVEFYNLASKGNRAVIVHIN